MSTLTTTAPTVDQDAEVKFSITIKASTRRLAEIAAATRGLFLKQAYEEAIQEWAERNQSNNFFGTTGNETSRTVLSGQVQKAS